MAYIGILKDFLNKEINKNKLVVIYGPTGCGKTDMSINIAKQINSEIISTDSRQIFKYLDIGTGKIKEEEKKGIKHHMIDIISPEQNYSVGDYKREAENIIINLYKDNKIPILCGGTGLYIDSLIYDFNIPKAPKDDVLRKNLENEASKFGKEYIFEKLKKIDPNYDKNLHPNNLRYVIRALEVKILTGKSKTEFKKEKSLKYDVLFLTPAYGSREDLYSRIDKRVQKMFENGLLDEVKNLLNKGYKKNDFGLKSIGYEEVIKYLDGDISLEEAINLTQKNSRNYAKRQLTWFRKYSNYAN